jgi:hypothetical protein
MATQLQNELLAKQTVGPSNQDFHLPKKKQVA